MFLQMLSVICFVIMSIIKWSGRKVPFMEIATSKNVINQKLRLCVCFSDESEILRLDWNQLFKMQQNLKKPLTEQNRFAGDPH